MRTTATLLLLVLLATAAQAEDTLFERLHRGFDPRDPQALGRAAGLLEKHDPDYWHAPMTAGPLRGGLARRLSRAEAVGLLLLTESPEVVLNNLSFREDIGAIVLEADVLPRLLPDHRKLLIAVATESLLDGDRSLVVALLSDEPSVKDTAYALDWMKDPAGLRLLADVATGAVPLPAESLATLPDLHPDTNNRYHVRPLGEERVRALGQAAAEHEDGAMRAFAARILHASLERAILPGIIRAYRDADSWRIDDSEWMRIGANFGRITADRGVTIERRAAMLEGCFLWTHVRASEHPPESEEICAHLREVTTAADPALVEVIARMVRDHPTVAVGGDYGRRRPVPSYRGLLQDLAKRPGLPRRIATRLLATMDEEWPRGHRYPPYLVLPKETAKTADELRKRLADPPTTFEQRERGPDGKKWHVRTGLDPSGVIPRTILLRAHVKLPVLWEVLADAELVASWPEPNRKEAERLLAEREEERRWEEEEDEDPTVAEICARLPDPSVPWHERVRLLETELSEEEEYDMPALAAFFADRVPRLDSDLPERAIDWGFGLASHLEWAERPGGLPELVKALRVAIERVPGNGPRIRLRRRLAQWEENR